MQGVGWDWWGRGGGGMGGGGGEEKRREWAPEAAALAGLVNAFPQEPIPHRRPGDFEVACPVNLADGEDRRLQQVAVLQEQVPFRI